MNCFRKAKKKIEYIMTLVDNPDIKPLTRSYSCCGSRWGSRGAFMTLVVISVFPWKDIGSTQQVPFQIFDYLATGKMFEKAQLPAETSNWERCIVNISIGNVSDWNTGKFSLWCSGIGSNKNRFPSCGILHILLLIHMSHVAGTDFFENIRKVLR